MSTRRRSSSTSRSAMHGQFEWVPPGQGGAIPILHAAQGAHTRGYFMSDKGWKYSTPITLDLLPRHPLAVWTPSVGRKSTCLSRAFCPFYKIDVLSVLLRPTLTNCGGP